MSTFFIGNFDFEHSLTTMPGRSLTEAARRINAELAAVWIAIAHEGDVIETPQPFDDGFADDLIGQGFPAVHFSTPGRIAGDCAEFSERSPGCDSRFDVCPWGWTESVEHRAKQRGWTPAAPEISAVRAVNSRRFSSQLEREWNVGLPGSATIDSIAMLESTIGSVRRNDDRWVLKAEFGMSGRERLPGRGRHLPAATRQWVRRRLAADGMVFFEPWVDRIDEAGLQFSIPPDDPPVLEGVTPSWTSPAGAYRRSRFDAATDFETTWRAAVEIGQRVAGRAQQAGYFGPLGIDAMRYQDADGIVRLRPIQDINARWTMGRISLGFRQLLRAGECGVWLHTRPGIVDSTASLRRWYQQRERTVPDGLRLIRTSPFAVGERPAALLTLLLIGRSQCFSAAERWSAELL